MSFILFLISLFKRTDLNDVGLLYLNGTEEIREEIRKYFVVETTTGTISVELIITSDWAVCADGVLCYITIPDIQDNPMNNYMVNKLTYNKNTPDNFYELLLRAKKFNDDKGWYIKKYKSYNSPILDADVLINGDHMHGIVNGVQYTKQPSNTMVDFALNSEIK